jgi:bisphosphoglycerate-dependent phosphoglycerate mutase
VERLFSTFLVLNKRKYKILNYPSDFSIYKKYIGENYKELEKSFKIKLNMIEKENKDLYFNEWKKQLIKIKSSMPIIPIPDLD